MSFRKDEIATPESSDCDEQNHTHRRGLNDAKELVDEIDEKLKLLTNVVRGMDKRMSYNLRLINTSVL